MSTRKISYGVKSYIFYVKIRAKLVKLETVDVSDNQYLYYQDLNNYITKYGKTHRLYFNYEIGKLQFEALRDLLGKDNRSVFRFLKEQRENFVDFIQQKENELFLKYPFDDKLRIGE